jgi:hypothetical protein
VTGGVSTSALFPAADLLMTAFSPRSGGAFPALIGATAGEMASGAVGISDSPAALVEAFGDQLLEALLFDHPTTFWAPGAIAPAPAPTAPARPQEAEGAGLPREGAGPLSAGFIPVPDLLPLPPAGPARPATRARAIGNSAVEAAGGSAMGSAEGLAAVAPAEAEPLVAAPVVPESRRAGDDGLRDHGLSGRGFRLLRSPFWAGELQGAANERGYSTSLGSAAVETQILLPPAGEIPQRVLDGHAPVAESGIETVVAEPDGASERASASGPEPPTPPRWMDPTLDAAGSTEPAIVSAKPATEQPRVADAISGSISSESAMPAEASRHGDGVSAPGNTAPQPIAAGDVSRRADCPVFVARITRRPGFSELHAPAEPHTPESELAEPRVEATESRIFSSRPELHEPAPASARKPAAAETPAEPGKNDAARDTQEPRRRDTIELPGAGKHLTDERGRPARLDQPPEVRRRGPAADTAHPASPARAAIARPGGEFATLTAPPSTRMGEGPAVVAIRAAERVGGPAETPPREAPRDLSLRMTAGGEESVAIRLEERSGDLRVSVRTRDSRLAESLREGAPELVSRLDQHGYDAEIWRPGGAISGERFEVRRLDSSEASAAREFGDAGGSGSSAEHDRGRRRDGEAEGQWSEELEALFSGAGSKEKEGDGRKR